MISVLSLLAAALGAFSPSCDSVDTLHENLNAFGFEDQEILQMSLEI